VYLYLTEDIEKVTGSASDDHRIVMNSIDPEPLKEFQPKLTQTLSTVGPQTD